MKILILGAGATGGYFGGRLAAAGADVKFLVREKRAQQLADHGLVIESPFGNDQTRVKTVLSDQLTAAHDVIVVSCKAYDLDSAIDAIRPAVGSSTLVLPLLNGIKHLDTLDAAFGAEHVLGGSCHLSVTLGENGEIRHLNQLHLLTFGPRMPSQLPQCRKILDVFSAANFEPKMREDMMQAMWDKWVLLASLAGLTCLFRASVGEISATPHGRGLMLALIEECRSVAQANGHEPSADHMANIASLLTDPSSKVVASMLRDMQKNARIEADLIIGDMLARGEAAGLKTPLLSVAATNLACYEAQRVASEA
ncbi:MAG: 2-dehydropantoate 2-reductase [Hyphomicrobiaceae bacterium]